MAKTTTTSSNPLRGESGLSLRLSTLTKLYRHRHSIWDIGCDHGKLGLSFIDNPSVAKIYLVDPSRPVFDVLLKTIDSYITKENFFKICPLFQKGQEVTLNPESKTIYIAGMGGREIEKIFSHLYPQLSSTDELIISPHKNIIELRAFLRNHEIFCESEELVLEDGQYYQILKLTKDNSFPRVSLYGEGLWQHSLGPEYQKQQLKHFSRHKDPQTLGYLSFLASL